MGAKLSLFQSTYTHNRSISNHSNGNASSYCLQRGGLHNGAAAMFRSNPLSANQCSNMNAFASKEANVNKKMNAIRQRNAFLEQQVADYQVQQALDYQRIIWRNRLLYCSNHRLVNIMFNVIMSTDYRCHQ